MPQWLPRLLIAAAISAAGFSTYWLYNQLLKSARSNRRGDLPFAMDGRPAILYFTTPDCVPCKTIQRPALKALAERLGKDKIQIHQVDTTDEPDLAKKWGVMTVPTTFIIDRNGRIRHINHGVTGLEKLQKQLSVLTGD